MIILYLFLLISTLTPQRVYISNEGNDSTCKAESLSEPCASITKGFSLISGTGSIIVTTDVTFNLPILLKGSPLTVTSSINTEDHPERDYARLFLTSNTIVGDSGSVGKDLATFSGFDFQIGGNSQNQPFLMLMQTNVDVTNCRISQNSSIPTSSSPFSWIAGGSLSLISVTLSNLALTTTPFILCSSGNLFLSELSIISSSLLTSDPFFSIFGDGSLEIAKYIRGSNGRPNIPGPCSISSATSLISGTGQASIFMDEDVEISGFTSTDGLKSVISWSVSTQLVQISGTFKDCSIRGSVSDGAFAVVVLDFTEFTFTRPRCSFPSLRFHPSIVLRKPQVSSHPYSVQPSFILCLFAQDDATDVLSYSGFPRSSFASSLHSDDVWAVWTNGSPTESTWTNSTLFSPVKATFDSNVIFADEVSGVDSATCGLGVVDQFGNWDTTLFTPCKTFAFIEPQMTIRRHTIKILSSFSHNGTMTIEREYCVKIDGYLSEEEKATLIFRFYPEMPQDYVIVLKEDSCMEMSSLSLELRGVTNFMLLMQLMQDGPIYSTNMNYVLTGLVGDDDETDP